MGGTWSIAKVNQDSSHSTSNQAPPTLNMSAMPSMAAPSMEEVNEAIVTAKELFGSPAQSNSSIEFSSETTLNPFESEQQAMVQHPSMHSDGLINLGSLKHAIDLCSMAKTSAVKELIIESAMDSNVWDAFLNCKAAVKFRNDLCQNLPKENPLLSTLNNENIHTIQYQNSELAKDDRMMKLILEKTRELIFQTVTKAFDGMEKLLIPDTKSQQKDASNVSTQQKHAFMNAANVSEAEKVCIPDTKSQQKQAFMDVANDSETPSTAYVIMDHIMRTPL